MLTRMGYARLCRAESVAAFSCFVEPANVSFGQASFAKACFDAPREVWHFDFLAFLPGQDAQVGDDFPMAGDGDLAAGMFMQHFVPLLADLANSNALHGRQYVRHPRGWQEIMRSLAFTSSGESHGSDAPSSSGGGAPHREGTRRLVGKLVGFKTFLRNFSPL